MVIHMGMHRESSYAGLSRWFRFDLKDQDLISRSSGDRNEAEGVPDRFHGGQVGVSAAPASMQNIR
jgi:hypothetical protein